MQGGSNGNGGLTLTTALQANFDLMLKDVVRGKTAIVTRRGEEEEKEEWQPRQCKDCPKQ
jgi:hypothetical protein